MANPRRRPGTPLIKRLLREPHRFDFFQAVRLLEWMQPDREPVGEGLAAGREAARFRASPSLDFAPSDVVNIAPPRAEGDVPEMTVAFLGVAGTNGPLPRPFTELVVERAQKKDRGMLDFLDIFHHRLLSLFYRARKRVRVSLSTSSPEKAEEGTRLLAMSGLGTFGLRNRLALPDRALLRYAGILNHRPRSMHGLERVLSDYFGERVRARSLVGQWLQLEEDQQTRLGGMGQNSVLGRTAVLGSRVWDQQGKFEVVVGPLSLQEFTGFLPGGERLAHLVSLTRFYIGPDLDFDVRLKLAASEVPESRLGAAVPPLLGWTSWLTREGTETDPEIHIRDPEQTSIRATSLTPSEDRGILDAPTISSRRPAGSEFATVNNN